MKNIIVGASGASGIPVLIKCLKVIKDTGNRASLILSDNAVKTIEYETDMSVKDITALAECVYDFNDITAAPSSGTYPTDGMLIVPCSMKTTAGINSGYSDNLLLRAADVTLKEQRTLVLGVREAPFSPIHLRNMQELSLIPGVRIVPLMMSFYNEPETIDDMVTHIAYKLLEPFKITSDEYKRWK